MKSNSYRVLDIQADKIEINTLTFQQNSYALDSTNTSTDLSIFKLESANISV